MSEPEAAYIAGLFDGEGCLSLTLAYKRRSKNPAKIITVGLVLTIANTCQEVLNWCQTTIGCGIVVQTHSTRASASPRNLPIYRYVVSAAQALEELLPQLRPFLRIKYRQADDCLAFIQGRNDRRRGAPFSENDIDRLFSLRLANQKSYNKGREEHILYKGRPLTRIDFREMLLCGRDGSIYHSVAWTPAMDALLGTSVDREIAHTLGLKLAQVQRRRTHLGIPIFGLNSLG